MGAVGTENKDQNPRRNHLGLNICQSGWQTYPRVRRDKCQLKDVRIVQDRDKNKDTSPSNTRMSAAPSQFSINAWGKKRIKER